MIIGLCGPPGAGKDTTGEILATRGFQKIAVADPLRQIAYDIDPNYRFLIDGYGYETAKTVWGGPVEPYARTCLIHLSIVLRRELGENVLVHVMEGRLAENSHTVVTDIRFQKEALAVRRRGGFIVSVSRPGFEVPPVHGVFDEFDIMSDCDYSIQNNGTTGDLAGRVDVMLVQLRERRKPWISRITNAMWRR